MPGNREPGPWASSSLPEKTGAMSTPFPCLAEFRPVFTGPSLRRILLPHWEAPGEILCMWGWKLVFVLRAEQHKQSREERLGKTMSGRSPTGGFRVTESSAPSLPLCTQCPPEPPSRHPVSHPAMPPQGTSSFTELLFPVMGDIRVARQSQKQEPISSGRVLKGGPCGLPRAP